MATKNALMVNKSLKTIASVTLMSTVIWTAISVYNGLKKPIDLNIEKAILEPIDPRIDTETLEIISKKRQLTDDVSAAQILQQAILLAATPEPSSTPQPSASAEATSSAQSSL